ncbi:YeaC family protein [Marinospirillum sp.]|uniref:YeaC family protein n=1 Tax=Marinospirillum sp. TaxID=2183934 RepID=UPI003A852B5A
MTFAEMIEKMSPEIYLALKRGVELGKWPNGQALTAEQREISMEAILRYEVVNQVPETERVGYITPKPKKNQPAQDDVSSIKILH